MNLHSGGPFNVIVSGNPANTSRGTIRPNLTGDPNLPADERTIAQWFDTSAFTAPAPFTFGNAPRNSVEARAQAGRPEPPETRRSSAVSGLEFRLDMFNAFNTPQFGSPGRAWARPPSAQITSTGPAREIQRGPAVHVLSAFGTTRWRRTFSKSARHWRRRSRIGAAARPPCPVRRCAGPEAHRSSRGRCRGTRPLTITAVEPIVIRAPRTRTPEGPVSLEPALGATTGGKGLWNRLDHASPSRTAGVRAGGAREDHHQPGADRLGRVPCAGGAADAGADHRRICSDRCSIGQDARQVEALWHAHLSSERVRGYATGAHLEAMAGIDMALWDILGKFAGAPVYQLLGGTYRDRIPTYATFSGTYTGRDRSDRPVVDQAKQMAASGFTVLKLALRKGPDSDEFAMVKAIADALAPNAQVAVDALGAFTFGRSAAHGPRARSHRQHRLVRGCAAAGRPSRSIRISRARVDTAICAGEMLSTRFQFRDLLIDRGADMVNPDLGRAGGITECRRIAWIADVFGALWAPHVSTG